MESADNRLTVAVLSGGVGTEREVSIQSGNCVATALRQGGVDVVIADIRPDEMSILDDGGIDVFFIALHGEFGEDGQLQQILEDRSLVYTGSGPEVSRLVFDKIASKKAFVEAGIKTPSSVELNLDSDVQQVKKQLRVFGNKYVVKPIRQGSSVGISIVEGVDEAVAIAGECLSEFGDCMIEEFIEGAELTVGVLCGQGLPIIEIQTANDFYDY